jgi:hypothetical protein
MPDERRREGPRIRVRQPMTLMTSDGLALIVTLQDISRDGLKIQHGGEDFVVGEIVVVKAGRSEARAQIAWTTPQEAGAKFIDDVSDLFTTR